MHKGLFHADSVAVRTKSEAGYFWPRMESSFDVYVQPLALDLTSNDAILNQLFIIKDCSSGASEILPLITVEEEIPLVQLSS